MKVKIAENIRNFRKEHSLTQEQLAEAMGVTVGAVYKWEAGLSTPEIKLIMEMADLFEISVDVLLGYENQSGSVQNRIARIRQYMQEKNLEEAVTEAQKALKKYPNNFDVVYLSGVIYHLKFTEDKDEVSIEKSNELFQHAISLLYQNTDKRINQATILNYIAENYLMSEKNEQAMEILKQNNICGTNSSLIGFIYARKLKRPEDARPYLMRSFVDIFNNAIRTAAGMVYMYTELNDEAGMEAALWLCDFLDSIKNDHGSIAFTDKIKSAVMAQCAVLKAASGSFEESEEYVRNAYLLAEKFDDAPIYSLQGIKFFQGEDAKAAAYDDIGKTAIEAAENIIFDETEDTDAHKFVREIWEKMKNGKNK